MYLNNTKKYRLLSVFIITMLIISSMTSLSFADDYTQEELDVLREIIIEKYVDPITSEELKGNTPKELFSNLDQHSLFYSTEDLEEFMQRYTGEYAGIGAYIKDENGKIVIIEPFADSPAEKAGLKAGDEIYSVDGEVLRGLTAEEGAAKVRGPVGTKVVLGIIRGKTEKVDEYTIVRATIVNNPISFQMIEGIAYIRISEFNEHAYENFSKVIGKLKEDKVKDVILDIRDNPGGGLDEVVDMARLLVPKGPIVHIGFNSHNITYSSFLANKPFENLVVLANENSASASEILAAAIQDSNSGTIIGKKTYGKGTVQRIYFLMNGEGFKITEARYLSPNKTIIDGVGVTPDIEVERLPYDINIQEFMPISFENEYEFNDRSDEIKAIQQRLSGLGYYVADKAGYFGVSTRAALNLYAKDKSIEKITTLTTELQEEIEIEFLNKLLSFEYDIQLNAAIEYINEAKNQAEAQ